MNGDTPPVSLGLLVRDRSAAGRGGAQARARRALGQS